MTNGGSTPHREAGMILTCWKIGNGGNGHIMSMLFTSAFGVLMKAPLLIGCDVHKHVPKIH